MYSGEIPAARDDWRTLLSRLLVRAKGRQVSSEETIPYNSSNRSVCADRRIKAGLGYGRSDQVITQRKVVLERRGYDPIV